MGVLEDCRSLSDEELTKAVRFLAHHEKRAVARLLAHLSVFDERQLCLKTAGRSLFEYCVRELGYDESDAYRRIRAARVAGRYPICLDLVEHGKLTLTSLVVLHPVLTEENYREWFAKAAGKTRRQLEALVVARFPEQARPDMMRHLPAGAPQFVVSAPVHAVDVLSAPGAPAPDAPAAPAAPGGEPVVEWLAIPAPPAPSGRLWQDVVPVSAERVRVGFDAAAALMRLIERARQLLRHKFPEGRLEDVVREALETFLDRRDPQRRLALKAPAPARREHEHERLPVRFLRAYSAGRYITAKIKTAVWARDDGRCAWRFEDGTPCGSRDAVEFDHVIPFAKGGRSEYRNLRLLCRAHNRLAAELAFPRPAGMPSPRASSYPIEARDSGLPPASAGTGAPPAP